jgi:hypothetical protein
LDRGGTWRNREDSYKEDHYPYAQRDVVDDTIHEEDFQDVNDKNDYFPRYPLFHGNIYNQTERHPEPPPFHSNEWDGERRCCTRIIQDDTDIM